MHKKINCYEYYEKIDGLERDDTVKENFKKLIQTVVDKTDNIKKKEGNS